MSQLLGLLTLGALITIGIANYKKQKKEKNNSPGSNTFIFILFLWIVSTFFYFLLPNIYGRIFSLIFLGVIALFRFQPQNKRFKSK